MSSQSNVQNYFHLKVLEKARALVLETYELTENANFPKSELYGVVAELRSAAASCASNIYEGEAFRHLMPGRRRLHLMNALAAVQVVRSGLWLSLERQYIGNSQYQSLDEDWTEVSMMLHGLIKVVGKKVKASK